MQTANERTKRLGAPGGRGSADLHHLPVPPCAGRQLGEDTAGPQPAGTAAGNGDPRGLAAPRKGKAAPRKRTGNTHLHEHSGRNVAGTFAAVGENPRAHRPTVVNTTRRPPEAAPPRLSVTTRVNLENGLPGNRGGTHKVTTCASVYVTRPQSHSHGDRGQISGCLRQRGVGQGRLPGTGF